MVYCPDWIFDVSVVRVASEFLSEQMPIDSYAKKYSKGLSESYHEVFVEELLEPAEEILRFLNEAKVSTNAIELLSGYSYFRMYYVNLKKKRRLQPIFGTLEAPSKNKEYSSEKALKSFRAYIFGKKSNTVPVRPSGWVLENDESLDQFSKLIKLKTGFGGSGISFEKFIGNDDG